MNRLALRVACLGFLLLCAAVLIRLPVHSVRDGSLAEVSIYLGGEGESPGVFIDRDFDFPTGYPYFDIPVWMIQTSLVGISGMLLLLLVRTRFD